MADWRHAVVLGLLGGLVALSAILFASGFGAAQVLVVSALVLVPLGVTAAVFALVWRWWGLGRERQR